jgi:hypothetical protein
MKKILICLFFYLLIPIILAQPEAPPGPPSPPETQEELPPMPPEKPIPENKTMPQKRGKGLTEAIKHVPSFVAEKLAYMISLFADGIRGIGKALSDWVGSFFKPVTTKGNVTS